MLTVLGRHFTPTNVILKFIVSLYLKYRKKLSSKLFNPRYRYRLVILGLILYMNTYQTKWLFDIINYRRVPSATSDICLGRDHDS